LLKVLGIQHGAAVMLGMSRDSASAVRYRGR
jgi:hypothetical protein